MLQGQLNLERFEFDLAASNLAKLIGKPAPELAGIKGWKNSDPLRFEELRGKVVVLEFFGYWCGPCVHKNPRAFSCITVVQCRCQCTLASRGSRRGPFVSTSFTIPAVSPPLR